MSRRWYEVHKIFVVTAENEEDAITTTEDWIDADVAEAQLLTKELAEDIGIELEESEDD